MQKEQIAALVRKAQAGDEQAMSDLLELAHGSVIFQCRKIMAHPEDAEDMAQEVLIKIYEKLDTLQTPETFLSWANTIAARLCINDRQRNPKDLQFAEDEEGHSVLDSLEDLDRQNVPDAAIDNAETRRMIVELIDNLPEAQRTSTYLYYYDELSVKEIAEMLDVPENTIKSRLNYARKAIKEGVLDYEKKGVKLYGLSPLPFLLYFLRGAAESSADPAAAATVAKTVLAAEGTVGVAASAEGIAAGTASSVGEAAAGHAAEITAEIASNAAAKSAAGIFSSVAAKVTAGVLAGAVAIGGVGLLVSDPKEEPAPVETPYVEETVQIASYTMERTVVDTQGYPVEIYIEAPRFEETSDGYRKLNETFDSIREKFLSGEDHNAAYLLEHLDEATDKHPLFYIETYQVVSQDETSVTIEVSLNRDFGLWNFSVNGSGGWTITIQLDDQAISEQKMSAMQTWLEEVKAQYASGGYEYGNNFFVFYRPEFGLHSHSCGSPKTQPVESAAPVNYYDTYVDAYGFTWVEENQDGNWVLYINGAVCGYFEQSAQAAMAGIDTYDEYIRAFSNDTYYLEHTSTEQTAEDIAPRPIETW